MELLYTLFIYPLEIFMEFVLRSLLDLTGDPVLSLTGLSLAVTVVSFPLSHIAESWQDRERAIQKKIRPKIDEFKNVFKGRVLDIYLNTLYRQNRYHPIFAVRSSFGLLIQIPFFFAAYHFISKYQAFIGAEALFFEDLGKPDGLLTIGSYSINIMPFVMTAVNFCSALVYGKKLSVKENVQLYAISLLFLVLLYNSPSALLIYWTASNFFSLLKNGGYQVFGKLKKRVIPDVSVAKEYNQIFFFSALTFGFLLFLTCQITLLASGSADDIEGAFYDLVSFQLMLFTVYTVILSVAYSFLPAKLKKAAALFFSLLLTVSLANTFLFAGDYGDMTNFFFENGIVTSNSLIVLNIMVLLLTAVAVAVLFLKKPKLMSNMIAVSLISVFILTIHEGYVFYDKIKDRKIERSDKIENKFTFSVKNKNVLIIMLDRFIGSYIPDIFELYPDLDEIIDGFVWYPNSLSSGSDTLSSEPSIMGGWDYHAKTINETRTDVPLLDKLNESIRVMPYNFAKAGFDTHLYGYLASWLKLADRQYVEKTEIEDLTGKYLEVWLKEKEMSLEMSDDDKKLALFGFFRVSPPFVRNYIYDNGKWNLYKKSKNDGKVIKGEYFVSFKETNKSLMARSLKNGSTIDYLPEMSEISDSAPGQFYYFSTKFTHEPWLTSYDLNISVDGDLKYPKEKYLKFNKSFNALKHIYTDAAALKFVGEWFQWMKEKGVYDNTRIIIVSDHGRDVFSPAFKKQKVPGTKRNNSPVIWNNVMMVKDFDSHGKLEKNGTFMSTGDVPYLAMHGILDGVNPYTGSNIVEMRNKIPFTVSRTKFRMREQEKYRYTITESFRITDSNIFDLSKWKRVENK